MGRYIAVVLAFSFVMLSAKAEVPIVPKKSDYAVYESDINGDGCPDYLVKGRGRIIFLGPDLGVPIKIPSRTEPFMLVSGVGCNYSTIQKPSSSQLSSKDWVASNYRVIDNNSRGDKYGSLLVYSNSDAGILFNIARGEDPKVFSLLQTLDGVDLGLPSGANLTLINANSDARSDLLLIQDDGVRDVYVANEQGVYAQSGASAATETWNLFVKRLQLLDTEGAVALVGEGMRDDVRNELNSPDADPAAFCSSIVRFEILEEESMYVSAVVVLANANLGDIAHYVNFKKGSDNIWRIDSL